MQAEDIFRLMKNNGFDKLINIYEIIQMTSLSKSTIYRLVKAGKFPEAIRASQCTSRWRLSDVQEWIKNIGEENE